MAAVQQHTRTRSARLGGPVSRPLSASAKQLHAASQGTPLNAGTNGVSASNGSGGNSPLSIFLTNLRLLDLDRLPDWPGITTETFTATATTVQAQKKRIQCVEWALFYLF